MTLLDRETILEALTRLDRSLGARRVRADLAQLEGAVMCLVYRARPATRDVDAWFAPAAEVRAAAGEVASELGLAGDWLNDAAKAFLPANAGYETIRDFENLTVFAVDAETLLAMKCAAARVEADAGDIRHLARHLGLASAEEVLAVVSRYYPAERLPVRARLLLEEMFDEGA